MNDFIEFQNMSKHINAQKSCHQKICDEIISYLLLKHDQHTHTHTQSCHDKFEQIISQIVKTFEIVMSKHCKQKLSKNKRTNIIDTIKNISNFHDMIFEIRNCHNIIL